MNTPSHRIFKTALSLIFIFAISLFNIHSLPAQTHSPQQNTNESDILFQYSTINALLIGLLDGDLTFAELQRHGDFGIGTFNGADGEMLQLDGEFYQIRSDGLAYPVTDEQKTPFANTTFFEPDLRLQSSAEMDYAALEQWILQQLPSHNLFYAIKVTGTFSYLRARSVPAQTPPYPPLVEVVRQQSEFEFQDVQGTLVGFYVPKYAQDINVTGYHFHFLTQDRQRGGHVLEMRTQDVTIEIDITHSFSLILPQDEAFYQAHLESDDVDEVEKPSNKVENAVQH